MAAGWLFGRFWCVCVSFEDVLAAYFGWFVVGFVHYVAHTQAISHVESDSLRLCLEVGLKLVTALIYICHGLAMWSDPGFVAPDTTGARQAHFENSCDANPTSTPPSAADAHKGFCLKCCNVKPADAHHCSKCGRCVHVMDHHCPWTNNCVGRRNIKFFLLFLFYTGLGSAYAFGLLLWRASTLQKRSSRRDHASGRDHDSAGFSAAPSQHLLNLDSPSALVPPILWTLATCLALGFCVFVIAMLSDQHHAIVSQVRFKPRRDASARERERREMRGEEALPEAPSRPLLSALAEACGEAPHPRWLLPVRAPAHRSPDSGGLSMRAGRGLETCTPVGFTNSVDEREGRKDL